MRWEHAGNWTCTSSLSDTGSMSKLKSHTGSRWTEYSRWKSLLICILICWEQNYLGARPDDAGTMLSMDGPPTDDPTELLLLLYTPKRRQTVASHQSLLSVSQIVLLHIIFHNDKSSEQKVHSMKRWVEQLERGRWVNLTKASRHLQQCCLQLTCIWFNLHHTWGLLMKCETFVWCITLAESCLPTCSRSWQWGLRFSTFSSSSW